MINFELLISRLIFLLNHVISVGYWLNLLLCVLFCRFVHRFIELEGLNCLLDFLEKMDFETRWVKHCNQIALYLEERIIVCDKQTDKIKVEVYMFTVS